MATSGRRRLALVTLGAAAAAMLVAPLSAAAQAAVPAAEAWWIPLAFQGHQVGDVRVDSGQITVAVAGLGTQQSSDGGRTWQPITAPGGVTATPQGEWQVRNGAVGRVDATGTWHADPGSPRVAQPPTAGHATVAALAARDGLVVAIDVDNVVWRRGGDGRWARALLLLPQDAVHGPPRATGVTTFTQPLTDAVYLATDGYSVLESTDGGDDWVRAGPGLPDGVLAITTDSPRRAVYAATRDGLWLHHLQATPAPPVYRGEDLTLRILGVVAVCVAAAALSVAAMFRLLRPV